MKVLIQPEGRPFEEKVFSDEIELLDYCKDLCYKYDVKVRFTVDDSRSAIIFEPPVKENIKL